MRTRRIVASVACATAAVGMGAHAAPSAVQLYGLVGAWTGTSKPSGAPQGNTVVNGGGLTTSFFGIRGEEDLGGGNAAYFTLESFFQPDTGAYGRTPADPLFSKNAYVGLRTRFGKVSLGRHMNPTYINMQAVNPFVGSVSFSPLVLQALIPTFDNAILGDSVWNNTVQYTTPSFGGLVGTLDYGAGEVAGRPGVANVGVHARYDGGPLTAVVSAQRVRLPGAGTVPVLVEQKAWLAGFAYDAGFARLYAAGVGTDTYGTPTSTRTWSVGAGVPVSRAGTVLFAYANTDRHFPLKQGTERQTATLAYDYALSKRTDIYVLAMVDKRSGAGAGTSSAIGLRHSF